MSKIKEIALQVDHLSVNYGKSPALWDVSCEIPTHLLCGIMGPNGAGKSTFIKAILDLIPKISGQIQFLGQPLSKMRQKVAYVPQRESVDWDFPISALDLVLMGRYGRLGFFCPVRKADKVAAMHYLEKVGMDGFANRQISQLSGGQQQRIFLARALLQDATIYLMDEPFAAVDMATEKVLIDILKEMKKAGKTVFVVHHDFNTVEDYFDWAILLNMRLVAAGPLKESFTEENIYTAYGKNCALFKSASRNLL